MSFSVPVRVASIENKRKLLTFQKRALKWAFGNQNYKPLLCASNSLPICYTIIVRQMFFLSKNFNGLNNLEWSKYLYVQSCPLPLHSERYPRFITMHNFKPSQRKFSFFSVTCQIANKLSEMRTDIRSNLSTVKSDLTKEFQQRTTSCFNERLSNSWTLRLWL